ncbi:MAG: hypothetical protein Q8R78_02755 [Candidatus Omnitrophota bacterium]|nr:hypothetical protein [Candidatus Omnitrophota bacterium]
MGDTTVKNGAVSARDAKGRFAAGNPGGPGRPPAEFSITELLRAEIAQRPAVVKRWVDLMESEDERVALMAMTSAANRIEGNPRTQLDLIHKEDADQFDTRIAAKLEGK